MKRVLISAAVLAAAGAFVFLTLGTSKQSAAGTYKVVLDDAFGLVQGADFKVAGVPAGSIKQINLDKKTLHAVVTVQVTTSGFGQFHKDATCHSRPQSLIGEYYVDCDPGTRGSPTLKPGSAIPINHTKTVIPADLLQNVMRMPYRERFTLILNELGAAAAARSDDLQAALHRAVPALDETDKLLKLLANDSTTLQNLTRDSNTVITALANNSANVNRFIVEANRTAVATATQNQNLRLSFRNLPPLLEQLKPSLTQLSTTLKTNTPVLQNLNAASGQLHRLLTDLPPFANSARPAIKSLGQASVTGKVAVKAATPTVVDLNNFAKPTPELAQNLAIVLRDLDDRSRAVEPDPRSAGGKGFTGLEALLGYAFNQTLAINYYGPLGHMLAVDAFPSTMCSNYATPATISMNLKQNGSQYRKCYSFLGPNQPGVTTQDPSDPNATIPDPGGGGAVSASAHRAAATRVSHAHRARTGKTSKSSKAAAQPSSGAQSTSTPTSGANTNGGGSNPSSSSSSSTSRTASPASGSSGGPPINLPKTLGQIINGVGGSSAPHAGSTPSAPAGASSGAASSPAPAPSSAGSSGGGGSSNQAQTLLNYLMSP